MTKNGKLKRTSLDRNDNSIICNELKMYACGMKFAVIYNKI